MLSETNTEVYRLRSLAKNALTYGSGEVISRIITFLLLPVFTSLLSPTDFGVASILALVSMIVFPVFSLGFGAAIGITYYEGNDTRRKQNTIWTVLLMLLCSTCILEILAFSFPTKASEFLLNDGGYWYVFVVAMVGTGATIITVPLRLFLQFEERAKTYVAASVASTILSVGLSVLLVVGMRRGIKGLIEAGTIAQILTLGIFSCSALPSLRFGVNWKLARELLGLGLPLIPSFAFAFLLQHGNKYVLQGYRGLSEVGVYTVGFNLGLAINIATSAFASAWTPYFMRFAERKVEASFVLGRIATYYVFGFGLLGLMFFLFAKMVVMVMTQQPFLPAFEVVGFSACAQIFLGLYGVLLPPVYFAREVKYTVLPYVLATGIAILANMTLVPVFGHVGAGIGLLVGTASLPVAQYLWNKLRREVYVQIHYEPHRILLFGCLSVALAAASLVPRALSVGTEFLLGILGTLLLLGLLFSLLTPEERQTAGLYLRKLIPARLT